MAVRGRLSQIPKEALKQEKEIIRLYYEKGIRQKEIKDKLKLTSVSVVAEVLRRDMITRVENFKKISPTSENYKKEVIEIIKFLKNHRKLDYSSIGALLEIPRDTIFKIISDETSGLRNTLTGVERDDRNQEMLRLSQEEGLSVTEIGKRMGLSKQMVSRIFTDMGYKPIRGTRKVQITQKNIPILNKIMQEDCNARLKELRDELRRVKGDAASARQYSNRIIAELRCKLVKARQPQLETLNKEDISDYKSQCRVLKKVYNQLIETTGSIPKVYGFLEDIKDIINEVED